MANALPQVLIIDDDRSVHHLVKRALAEQKVEFLTSLNAEDGLQAVREKVPDVVLLDVMLPDMSGLEVFEKIRALDPRLPVIFITGVGTSSTAIQAMKLGAFDYLHKPIDVDELERLVDQALETRRLNTVPVGMENLLTPRERGDAFVGRCAEMQQVFKAIGRVAPQDVPVLVRGESGTGKELVARAIFQHGSRSDGPFLAVNCAALSETLLESELFGHEKGSFTGANDRRIGKFEQCDGGTIFLDEVGDMSPLVQGKVLRLLQQQAFERVGGNETISTNVRIVSATNRDLEDMCENGEFRSDLYYRLNGYTINLPPLRQRGDDRVILLQHLLAQLNKQLDRNVTGVAPEALQRLMDYQWPGNVREMESVVKQALLRETGSVLMAASLPEEVQPSPFTKVEAAEPDRRLDFTETTDELADFIEEGLTAERGDLYAEAVGFLERKLLTRVLQHSAGNQSEASRILGITRGSLRNKLRTNNISIAQLVKVEDDGVDASLKDSETTMAASETS